VRVLVEVHQLRRRLPGGIGTYSVGLLKGLAELGESAPEVTLLAGRGAPRGSRRPAQHRDPSAFGYPMREVPLGGRLLTAGWDQGWLRAPAGFDVVHSVSLGGPRVDGAAAAVTVHDLAWREVPDAFTLRGRRWHEAALSRALRRNDLFVVPSERTADALVAAGAPSWKVAVIEEGADHLPPPDLEGAAALMRRLATPGPYLLCVGTLEPRKNLPRLLEAYAAARSALPERWPLVVVGPRGWGEDLAGRAGVLAAGPVSDAVLSALYAKARCVVYVPLVEGFGLPAVEAMAAGAPVVASAVPSAGGAALEVDPLDVDSIAAGLLRAATDEADRARLVEAGRERAAELTWSAAARNHVEAWTRAGETARSRRATGRQRAGKAVGAARRLTTSLRAQPRPTGSAPPPRRSERLALSLDVTAVPAHPAGAGRYTLDLATALAGRDDLDLYLTSRMNDAERWAALAPHAVVEAVAPATRPLRLAWEQARLPRLLAGLPLDVHHGPHYTMPETAHLPRVVTIHDLTFFDHPEWHERSKAVFFRRATRVAARHAAALICVSESTAARLRELCHPQSPVHVVVHGVDHARFRPDEPDAGLDEAVLRRLGVSAPYIAFVGTLEPRKDVPTLVGAFDRVCSAHPGLTLVLAGLPGWGSEAVEAAIGTARHRDRIVRLGYVPDEAVPAILRGAAAVAYPSLEEGFGLPALEALACGSPLVTTTGSAMQEMAEGAALLVDPGGLDALAGALDMLVRGDEALETRRARGLEIAARHTWEASAAAHMAVYRSAAATAGGSRATG
jgi:glycosyltransferase involved in cell wall biosynthesis